MITQKRGRARSHRSIEDVESELKKDISNLSKDELDTLRLLVAELDEESSLEQGERIIDVIGSAEFSRTPVDMETFVKDPYFLGNTCANLYPKWLEDLKELFEGGDYSEAIFTGAIGIGKTFVGSIGICRILYELSCMIDPHKSFGLANGSTIAIVTLSVNEVLARKVVFDNIANKLRASPYFQEHFQFDDTSKELRFPNYIQLMARSTSDTSVLGLNIIAAILDEGNFLAKQSQKKLNHEGRKVDVVDQAETLYTSIKRRMKSRFEKGGKLPGVLFILSSKNTNDDFTAKRIRDAMFSSDVFVRDYSLWECKPEGTFSDNKFFVLAGNENVPSRILDPGEEVRYSGDLCPENCVLVEVPEDFKHDFEMDLEGSLRDLAGVATVAVSPFIQRREKIQQAVVADREHPFSTVVYDPSRGGRFLWDRMVEETMARGPTGNFEAVRRPVLNPTAPRHIHIDPSLTGDATGFCMSHVSGFKQVLRTTDDGRKYAEKAHVYTVDVILQIVPPIGGEIVLGDLRHLVYDLTAHGYMITTITLDSWQCLARGTRVSTPRGLIPIEDIREQEIVISRSGPKRVLEKFSYEDVSTLIVHLSDGTIIEGTPNHKIEVVGEEGEYIWCRLDQLKGGELVRMADREMSIDRWFDQKWRYPLMHDKYELGCLARGYKGRLADWDPPAVLTPEFAEILGLVWGSGSITTHIGLRAFIRYHNQEEADLVIQKFFGVRLPFEHTGGKIRDRGHYSILGNWVIRLLDWNRLERGEVPEPIFRSPVEVQAAFIRGVASTWGSIYGKDGSISIPLKHKEFARQLQTILRCSFGIRAVLQRSRVSRGRAFDELNIKEDRDLFYEKIGFLFSKERKDLESTRSVGIDEPVFVERLEESRNDVFDIQVEGDPSYVANGVISHNSADSIQQFKKHGYRAEVLSVDISAEPYDNLKTALYENRLFYYEYPVLTKELSTLQEHRTGKRRKIDHPTKGSKDCSDSLAGCLYTLSKRFIHEPLPILQSQNLETDPWMLEQRCVIPSSSGIPTSGATVTLPPMLFGSDPTSDNDAWIFGRRK